MSGVLRHSPVDGYPMNKQIPTRLMNRTLNEEQLSWAIRFLFVISVFLIIILSFSYHSINRELIFYSERVDNSHEVLDKINEIRIDMYEVTYYGRGYLIAGDSANRRQLTTKSQKLPRRARELAALVVDNYAQVLKTTALAEALVTYKEKVLRFTNGNPLALPPLERETLLKNGSASTQQINTLLDEMVKIEQELMINRVQSRNNYKQQIFRFNWVIMGVALAFLLSSFILLERELKRNKLYKSELENKVENLNRSNNDLEQFAYVASHDLQEPLRKIRSFTDLLVAKSKSTLSHDAALMLEKIEKSAMRMQLLIDDLLQFSRLIDTSLKAETVDLNKVIGEVKSTLSETIRETATEIRTSNLPTVLGYPSQLIQLFQNLISNSIKYSKEGVAPTIDISFTEVASHEIPHARQRPSTDETPFYCITLKDNGIGFKKEYAEKIFVIFQRLHSKEKFHGSGIGLAICRKVISNHNGYILSDGEEGLGAKFYIYLPKENLFTR